MKDRIKIMAIFLCLVIVATGIFGQDEYKIAAISGPNGLKLENTTTTDTVTGVSAAAASLDTLYIGSLAPNQTVFKSIWLLLTTTNVNNQDSIFVRVYRGFRQGLYETTATQSGTLSTAAGELFLEINTAQGQKGAPNYMIIVDGTAGADTDSTAYSIHAGGQYADN